MAADAIRDGVEQHRPTAFGQHLLLAAEGIDDRQRVVSVHALGVHLVGIDSGSHARDVSHPHGLADGLPAHAVKIIHAVENDGQAAAQRLVPELAVLVHGGKRDAFPHGAAAERGIADVGDHDSRLAIDALEQCRSGGDGTGTAHDRVVGVDAERREERMHGAAQTAVESGFAREDFAVGAVDEEAQRQSFHGSLVALFDGA